MTTMTRALASAAATDAANRRMRKAGRKRWNAADCNAAAKLFNELWPATPWVSQPIEVILARTA